MHSYKQKYYFKFICSLVLVMLAVSQVNAAGKGLPGTDDRSNWCYNKLSSCIKTANEDCTSTYANTIDLALCKSNEVQACKNSYGSTSDCKTRIRGTRASRKAEAAEGQKVIVAPKSSSRSQKNKLKNKALIAQPVRPKTSKDSAKKRRFVSSLKMTTASRMKSPKGTSSVAITVDDCTFYGGTVQKDTNCGTNQSCIIGNNNGCITKAAK